MIMQVGKEQNQLLQSLPRRDFRMMTTRWRCWAEYHFEISSKSKLWVLKSVYDGIFDSISDLGSIDDEIDIKVFKTNKDGETIVTDEQAADKTTKPKATKEAAKKPDVSKPSEEERFESQICQ